MLFKLVHNPTLIIVGPPVFARILTGNKSFTISIIAQNLLSGTQTDQHKG